MRLGWMTMALWNTSGRRRIGRRKRKRDMDGLAWHCNYCCDQLPRKLVHILAINKRHVGFQCHAPKYFCSVEWRQPCKTYDITKKLSFPLVIWGTAVPRYQKMVMVAFCTLFVWVIVKKTVKWPSTTTVASNNNNRLFVFDKTRNLRPIPFFVVSGRKQLGVESEVVSCSGFYLSSDILKCIILYILLWAICAYLLIHKARDFQQRTVLMLEGAEDRTIESRDAFVHKVQVGKNIVDSMMKQIYLSNKRMDTTCQSTTTTEQLPMVKMNEEMMQQVMRRLREQLFDQEAPPKEEDEFSSSRPSNKSFYQVWQHSCRQLRHNSRWIAKISQNDKCREILSFSESWLGRLAILFLVIALLRQLGESGITWIPW